MYANYIYIYHLSSYQFNPIHTMPLYMPSYLQRRIDGRVSTWSRTTRTTCNCSFSFLHLSQPKRTAEAKLFACDHCILRYSKS